MPARGRELHELRSVLRRLLERYPEKTRRSLDPDLQKVLALGDELSKLTEAGKGRGDDGELSRGQRAVRDAQNGAGDNLADINRDRSPGSQAGGVGLTPGQKAARDHSDAFDIDAPGSHRGKRRGARHMTTLRDLD